MNKENFFASVRTSLFGGTLTNKQVEGMEAIIDYWETKEIENDRQLAYILATAYHETDKKMEAIEEYGKGKGKPYGKNIKHNGTRYNDVPFFYYGRGLVQLTWYENYVLMGRILGIDLLKNPELALELDIAVKILVEGMIRGSFTGRKLSQYFNKKTLSISARAIINGSDCDRLISGHYRKFLTALSA